jgi:hypothetical protein
VIKKPDFVKFLHDKKYLMYKEITEDLRMEELVQRYGNQRELRDDFYSVTFIALVYLDDPNEIYGLEDEDEFRGKELSYGEVQRCFMNCLLIFFM